FLRWFLIWVCLCFLVFIVGPKSKWKLKETTPSCSTCECYCSSPEESYLDLSLAVCGKDDPVINEEVKKDLLTMLSEELNLQKIVANETLEHTKRLIIETKKTFSQYQKEAEKCNVGVETCEKARERVEAELIEELRLSAFWENRAHEYGWNDIASL
ncbi:PREDICTED: uncharacterized protein LOC109329389, partial [Lupinus angustifolius]|uniref:uncharacterized protein LOC109329389 n=1 Tax=Lupinus angustifolius TaxID=3871 RepID=UPI00092EDBC0